MELIALIPARGGSKGIPRKNIVMVAGKPLIAHTIEAAKGAKGIARVIVSTDSEEIAAVAREYGAEVVMRPANIAADDTQMIPVLQHALEQAPADAIVLLQPTSPLRTSAHITEAIQAYASSGTDSLVSVMQVPHPFLPSSLYRMGENVLQPLSDTLVTRRQDKEILYARNGPAILIASASLIREGKLYGSSVVPYVMDKESSVDIDDAQDLSYAAFLLERR